MTGFSHTKLLYEIPEAQELLSLSRSVIFEQLKAGRLRSVSQGRSRRIPATAIDDYVALLEAEADHPDTGTQHGDGARGHAA